MVSRRLQNKNHPTLIIEDHPEDYNGVEWVTLIQYTNHSKLIVVNSLEIDYLWGYSIESMSEEECEVFYYIMEHYWTETLYGEPIRLRISPDRWITERGLGSTFGQLITAYNIENISRIVGPIREPDASPPKTRIRRRKRVGTRDMLK